MTCTGQVGLLQTQLLHERDSLAASRAAEAGLVARLHRVQEEASSSQLEVDHVRAQGNAHKRIAEGLRLQLRGAQAWAAEAETSFEEMLAQVRHTAGEGMAVHTRRCRLLDEKLARHALHPLTTPHPLATPHLPVTRHPLITRQAPT